MSVSARTVRRRLLEEGLVSRRAAKKPLLSSKKKQGKTDSAEGTGTGLLRTGVKSFSLMYPLCDCLGHVEGGLFGEDEVSATISPVSCQQ